MRVGRRRSYQLTPNAAAELRTPSRWTVAALACVLVLLGIHLSGRSPSVSLFAVDAQAHEQNSTAKDAQASRFSMPNFDFDDKLLVEEAVDDDDLAKSNESVPADIEDLDLDDVADETAPTDTTPAQAGEPFLGFSCGACNGEDASPTCRKYRGHPIVSPDMLERSIVFSGTNGDIKRILRKQIKSHLIGLARASGKIANARTLPDERPFDILVLGGSVSNGRGVDPETCWHSQVHQWLQLELPLEGDSGFNAAFEKHRSGHKHTKRASKGAAAALRRKRPKTRLVNAARSASGSAYFAYCFEEHMRTRGKLDRLESGVDLVVLEFGINDVYPISEQATRDFERLVRTIKALPSKPAIVILEAASLLLARTTSHKDDAEWLHLPVAKHYDIPILSMKQGLFGPANKGAASADMKTMFLKDSHHPNDLGHTLMADILIRYLEQQACAVQSELANETVTDRQLYEAISIPEAPELPAAGLFPSNLLRQPKAVCHQVGNDRTTLEPILNQGWSQYSWARDKQYMVADKPGSKLTYRVYVGSGGEVRVDWLRSRFYNLGDVLVYLDGQRDDAKQIAGYWELGWSIGVPTKVFENVRKGPHELTFELLGLERSSHPQKSKTHFRLIDVITT